MYNMLCMLKTATSLCKISGLSCRPGRQGMWCRNMTKQSSCSSPESRQLQ